MSWIDKLKAPKFSPHQQKSNFPEGLWTKCPRCSEIVFHEDVEKNLWVCPKCQHHFRIQARKRLDMILDPDSFAERDAELAPTDKLEFKDQQRYRDRIKTLEKSCAEREAFIY